TNTGHFPSRSLRPRAPFSPPPRRSSYLRSRPCARATGSTQHHRNLGRATEHEVDFCRLVGDLVHRLRGEVGELDLHDRPHTRQRSEEHTSELQSRENLVCRLLLEKKQPS